MAPYHIPYFGPTQLNTISSFRSFSYIVYYNFIAFNVINQLGYNYCTTSEILQPFNLINFANLCLLLFFSPLVKIAIYCRTCFSEKERNKEREREREKKVRKKERQRDGDQPLTDDLQNRFFQEFRNIHMKRIEVLIEQQWWSLLKRDIETEYQNQRETFFFREGGKNRILGQPNCFIKTSYFIFVDVDFTGLQVLGGKIYIYLKHSCQ